MRAGGTQATAPALAPAPVGAGRSPLGSSTRAGSRDNSFCPCHKTGENTGFPPVFFLPVLHGYLVHSASDCGFSHLLSSVSNRCHPLQHPESTRFRLFWPNRVCFALLTHKIFRIFFVHSVDMAHKLKSLVIPHSLVVSFLT